MVPPQKWSKWSPLLRHCDHLFVSAHPILFVRESWCKYTIRSPWSSWPWMNDWIFFSPWNTRSRYIILWAIRCRLVGNEIARILGTWMPTDARNYSIDRSRSGFADARYQRGKSNWPSSTYLDVVSSIYQNTHFQSRCCSTSQSISLAPRRLSLYFSNTTSRCHKIQSCHQNRRHSTVAVVNSTIHRPSSLLAVLVRKWANVVNVCDWKT